MTVRLNEYMGQVAKAAAEKQRLESELDVARSIQLGMLPGRMDCPGYDIAGMMLPAKEVGGDFYDFFQIGEDKLCIVVADVSGKGVGAALFMTIAKMVIKTAAQANNVTVDELLGTANNLLCQENPAELFVTAYVGIMDIGAASTQFLVVSDGLIEFTRILPVGGSLLTRSLAEYYGYELGQASQLKEERGRLLSAEEAAATSEEEMQMDFSLRDGLSELVREIRRSIDFYTIQEGSTPIERFVLSGGTVKLKGFREFMAEAMEVPVEFGDPGLAGQPVEETAPEFFDQSYAVAIGSALREVVE
jgi:Tfp pilus assembly PilM family ATPase